MYIYFAFLSITHIKTMKIKILQSRDFLKWRAYQNSTYCFAIRNLTTQPEYSAVRASLQPAAASSIFRGAATRIVSSDFRSALEKRVRGGTTSFAKRELFRATQRMFYQV